MNTIKTDLKSLRLAFGELTVSDAHVVRTTIDYIRRMEPQRAVVLPKISESAAGDRADWWIDEYITDLRELNPNVSFVTEGETK